MRIIRDQNEILLALRGRNSKNTFRIFRRSILNKTIAKFNPAIFIEFPIILGATLPKILFGRPFVSIFINKK
jgi:hypothetical protein